jgi:hypothetical protein
MPEATDNPDLSQNAQPSGSGAQSDGAAPFAPDELVAVVCASNGLVPRARLRAQGFANDLITAWIRTGVLAEADGDHLRLASPDVYIDPLIQALWRVPDGVIGGLAALEYYGLSTVWAPEIQIAIGAPRALEPSLPGALAGAAIHPLVVPGDLARYGVDHVLPSLPGSVAIAMYTPAVALAQVLADQDCDEETVDDAVARYVGLHGLSTAEREAARRYGVADRLERLARPYARAER